jgi:ADP-sugar diphosphatase
MESKYSPSTCLESGKTIQEVWFHSTAILSCEAGVVNLAYNDFFLSPNPFRIGFVKIKSDCTLVEEVDGKNTNDITSSGATDTATTTTTISHRLPGICFLRGNAVSVLVALFCEDSCYSLLVEQPRIPLGHASCWELPAGMMEGDSIVGTAVMELEEECGIHIDPHELVDLTALSCQLAVDQGHLPEAGIATSPGGCDEMVRFLYLERLVTREELEAMKDRLTGLREQGEVITLRVVPMEDVWKVSGDAKAML